MALVLGFHGLHPNRLGPTGLLDFVHMSLARIDRKCDDVYYQSVCNGTGMFNTTVYGKAVVKYTRAVKYV
jgi:hypothetical protein